MTGLPSRFPRVKSVPLMRWVVVSVDAAFRASSSGPKADITASRAGSALALKARARLVSRGSRNFGRKVVSMGRIAP